MDRATISGRLVILAVAFVIVSSVLAPTAVAQSGAQEEREPNDTRESATPIEQRTAIEGVVNDSDVDFFSFEASEGAIIRITDGFAAVSGGADATLVAPNGDVLGSDILGSSTAGTAEIGARAQTTGTYVVRLEADDTGSRYSFSVATTGRDRFEPNNDRGSTTRIDPNGAVEGTIVNGTNLPADEDWFAVEASAGENLTAAVEKGDGGLNFGSPETGQNLRIDVFDPDGERLGSNETVAEGGTVRDTASQRISADEEGTYYVRISSTDGFGGVTGFVEYTLSITGDGTAERPETGTNALVIAGGRPENKVSYEVGFEGSAERSGESHGAPIEDRHVTVDEDVDEIENGRIDGRLGGGGDAYLVNGEITGLELDGDARVFLDGEEVDPASFGSVSDRATSSPTPTSTTTSTPTATPSSTPTATPTPTPLPTTTTATATPTDGSSTTSLATGTQTVTQTTTPTAAEPTTSTGTDATTPTDGDGRIVGGATTEDETTSSSGPGFGLVSGLVAIVAAAGFAVRRR
ncbi:pre-peptidase C-terminal domain-containing protein [Halococcus saccharolyticus]|uniref:Pre-peptidase n=1 Tax=Halococcus saccharolyticus DSM 5350 TaxID=1227455 RepID=M0MBH6_9EURY|nr:pre-peptidase C-terminal domain-containing protein [Halococcus saccharolyticus]EMA43127.1 pre-peptidase [Halococcus saccharolyticus DSM 5350]